MKKSSWIQYFLVSLAPIIVTIILIRVGFNTSIRNFHPAWSDEVLYWQQINSFKEVGLDNGFFTFEEKLAESKYLQYGTHGPVFTIIYGGLSRIFGWSKSTGLFFNFFLVFISSFLSLLLLKPNLKQQLAFLVFLLLSYPLLFYVPTLMQESFLHALFILSGAILIHLVKEKNSSSILKFVLIILISIICLIRISAILFLPPVIYFMKSKRTKGWFLLSLVLSVIIALFFYGLFSEWTSPYPDWFFLEVTKNGSTILEKATILFQNSLFNLRSYFSLEEPNQTIEILFRFQYIALTILTLVLSRKRDPLFLTSSYILIVSFIILIILYDVTRFRDYRFSSPILFVSILVLIFNKPNYKKLVVWFFILFFVSTLSISKIFIDYYLFSHANHFSYDWDSSGQFYAEPISKIRYTKESDPWCNSLATPYISGEYYKDLSPGIGLNIILYPLKIEESIKSHYIFAPREYIDKWDLSNDCDILFEDDLNVLCEQKYDGCEK